MSDDREEFEQDQVHRDREYLPEAAEAPPLKFGATGELNALAEKLRGLPGPLLDSESFDLAEEVMSLCGVDPGRERESGLESCGPATMSDSEGVPLCTRCFIGLALDAAVTTPALTIENRTGQEVTYTVTPVGEKPANCPLTTGMRPCECDLPRCPECGYTMHDAQFEMDHSICSGTIPPSPPPAWTGADSLVEEVGPGPGDDALCGDPS